MKTNKVFALDLGTTKFCFATLVKTQDSTSVEKISVNAEGMRRGMLSDFDKAEKALLRLIDIAENEWSTNINKVVVGIAGSHLQSNIFDTTIEIQKNLVTQSHLDQLETSAITQKSYQNKENLHAIPIHYRLDDREAISDPIGFTGDQLAGKFFRIEADKHYLNDVVNLCNKCGLEVVNLFAEPYASALATLSDQEKQHGVLIADIGGGTTDGIIFSQGIPTKLFTINIGGMLMTHDLSIGLGIDHKTAEHLKHSIGLEKNNLVKDFYVNNIHKQNIKIVNEDFYMILFSRVLELTYLIKDQLDQFDFPLSYGVVLTGGGADVQGICQIMGQVLNTPVRKSKPNLIHSLFNTKNCSLSNTSFQDEMASKFSTVTGMLILDALSQLNNDVPIKHGAFEKYIHQFIGWIKEIS